MQNADKVIIGVIGGLVVTGWVFFSIATHSYTPPDALKQSLEIVRNADNNNSAGVIEATEDVTKELQAIEATPRTETLTETRTEAPEKLVVVPASPTLYTQYLGNGWAHRSWPETEVTFNDYVTITTSSSWGRLVLHAQKGFATEDFKSLVFNISSQDASNKALFLAFNDENHNPIQYIRLNDYIPEGAFKKDVSYSVAVPLADLNPAHIRVFDFILESESPNTFTIDTIAFSTNSNSTYWGDSRTAQTQTVQAEAPTISHNPVIFSDTFASGWAISENTLGSTASVSTAERFAGSSSLQVNYTDTWGMVRIEHPVGLDTTGTTFISFGAHGGSNGNQHIDIIIYNTEGTEISRRAPLDGDRLLAHDWKNIRIPLYQLNAENTIIGAIAFQVDESTSYVYFDEILLTN